MNQTGAFAEAVEYCRAGHALVAKQIAAMGQDDRTTGMDSFFRIGACCVADPHTGNICDEVPRSALPFVIKLKFKILTKSHGCLLISCAGSARL